MKTGFSTTVRRAAQRLGFTRKYVYDLLYEGKLPAKKIRGVWFISDAAIAEKRKQQEVEETVGVNA